MLDLVQTAVVDLLKRAVNQPVGRPLLPPATVEPYGQQLVMHDLIGPKPCVYVELDSGSLERYGDTTEEMNGEQTTDLICITENHVSLAEQAHDGAKLMAWVIQVLQTTPITIDDYPYRADRVSWARLGTDENATFWAARLSVTWESITI